MGTCFSRNNSLSTMNPKVGVCTRPMDASFQVLENLEHSKPTSLSINLLTLAELTSAVSISLASLIASLTDFSVISLNVTLFCESKSEKIILSLHAINSPSLSGSVAIYISSTLAFLAFFNHILDLFFSTRSPTPGWLWKRSFF